MPFSLSDFPYLPLWFSGTFVFLFGCCIGSFLNVVIYRTPQGGSVMSPARSYCPACKGMIAGYDNIPVVSYLLLGGKCRMCGARISIQYPLVEFLTGALFFAGLLQFGLTWRFAAVAVFIAAMVTLIFTDFNEQILPDVITLPGLALALAWRAFDHNAVGLDWLNIVSEALFGGRAPAGGAVGSLLNAAAGMAVGGGSLWLIGVAYFRLRAFRLRTPDDLRAFLKERCVLGTTVRLKVRRAGKTAAAYAVGGDFAELSEAERAEAGYEPPAGGSAELTMTALSGLEIAPGENGAGVRVVTAPKGLLLEDGELRADDLIVSGNIEGMGLGDVKMMLFVGAFLGGGVTFLVLLAASILGALAALPKIILQGRAAMQTAMPFGVMLGTATLLAVFFGEWALSRYLDVTLHFVR